MLCPRLRSFVSLSIIEPLPFCGSEAGTILQVWFFALSACLSFLFYGEEEETSVKRKIEIAGRDEGVREHCLWL